MPYYTNVYRHAFINREIVCIMFGDNEVSNPKETSTVVLGNG